MFPDSLENEWDFKFTNVTKTLNGHTANKADLKNCLVNGIDLYLAKVTWNEEKETKITEKRWVTLKLILFLFSLLFYKDKAGEILLELNFKYVIN